MTIRVTEIGEMGTTVGGRSRPRAALGPRVKTLIGGGSKSGASISRGRTNVLCIRPIVVAKRRGGNVILTKRRRGRPFKGRLSKGAHSTMN
jgi:hypothetical protein